MPARAEPGRGMPMAGLPAVEMIADAVAVPTIEIVRGEMMRQAVVVRKMQVAMKSVPIKATEAAAIKPMPDGGAEAGVRAAAMGDSLDLSTGDGKRTNCGGGQRPSQRHPHYTKRPRFGSALSAFTRPSSMSATINQAR
jgi:hypothetical protein